MVGPSTQDHVFVLHTRRYRENGLLIEALARDHGRLGLVARGNGGRRAAHKGALEAFRPLLAIWRGRGDLHNLAHWETTEYWPVLHGDRLLSGLYLNELVIRLTGRSEGTALLFERYATTVALLAHGEPLEPALRAFEVALLEACGYGLELTQAVDTGRPLEGDRQYYYVPELGPQGEPGGGGAVPVRGATLLALGGHRPLDMVVLPDAKRLMRALLAHHLGGRPLHARSLFVGEEPH